MLKFIDKHYAEIVKTVREAVDEAIDDNLSNTIRFTVSFESGMVSHPIRKQTHDKVLKYFINGFKQ